MANSILFIIGLVLLFIALILLWVGFDIRNKELKAGKSPNTGWWIIWIGTIIAAIGVIFVLWGI
jgi:hypothetical protein